MRGCEHQPDRLTEGSQRGLDRLAFIHAAAFAARLTAFTMFV
jgi:hypothetical protein